MTVDSDSSKQALSPEDVLLGDALASRLLICSLFTDQRPLKGVAGRLDWRLRGFLSRFVMDGHIVGARDEFVYIPIHHRNSVRHLMLVGLGSYNNGLFSFEAESKCGAALLTNMVERVTKLQMTHVTISRSSFPFAPFTNANSVRKAFKDIAVDFTQ